MYTLSPSDDKLGAASVEQKNKSIFIRVHISLSIYIGLFSSIYRSLFICTQHRHPTTNLGPPSWKIYF